jgi:ATP-dependent helicase HrpB
MVIYTDDAVDICDAAVREVLEETTIPHATPAAVAAALAEAVAARGLRDLPWTAAARQVQARIGWLRQVEGEAWPDLADTALGAAVQDWLAPHLHGLSKLAELAGLGLTEILLHRLDWPQRQRLDTALPARLALPAGRSAAIDYAREVPTLEARAPPGGRRAARSSLAQAVWVSSLIFSSPFVRRLRATPSC